MTLPPEQTLEVSHRSHSHEARRLAESMARTMGFPDSTIEEITIVVSELATNLLKHAGKGSLTFSAVRKEGRIGLRIVSEDRGPGIRDVNQVLVDGYSSTGSLGCGLGAVHRIMDELDVVSPSLPQGGVRLTCVRYLPQSRGEMKRGSLSVGAATRAHPRMALNGDDFVQQRRGDALLVGVIDGLGHGIFAHRAARTARDYIERHGDLPLDRLFMETGRACRATRGIVMALARFGAAKNSFEFASVGNISARLYGHTGSADFHVRRGILGVHHPLPKVTTIPWSPDCILVLHSDGVSTHWRWQDLTGFMMDSAQTLAHRILSRHARAEDDATVLVVREKSSPAESCSKSEPTEGP